MSASEESEGNEFFYMLLQALSILMIVLGVVLIFGSACVLIIFPKFTIVDLVIFIVGVLIGLVAYSMFHMKRNYDALSCYIIIVMGFLFIQLLFVIMIATVPDKAIGLMTQELSDKYKADAEKVLTSHFKLVKYSLFFLAVVLVLSPS